LCEVRGYFLVSELEAEELVSDFEVEVAVESDFDSDLVSVFESVEALASTFLSELPDDAGADFLRA
jgi:hypothetical protein